MMRSHGTVAQKITAGAFAAALLGAAVLTAPAALADDIPLDGSGAVDLTLEVEDLGPTGELSMSVDTSAPVALVESGTPGDTNRTFTGTLPTVTVTDTRSEIDPAVGWGVVGQASDFVNTANAAVTIPAEHLGWAPELLTDVDPNTSVTAGDEVESETEGGTGLAEGTDFLVWSFYSDEAAEQSDAWQANAELKLVVPADEVEAGNYTSTLTLSLFEG